MVTSCTPFKDNVPDADLGAHATPTGSTAPAPTGSAYSQTAAPGATSCDRGKPFGAPTFVAGLSTLAAPWVGALRLSPDYRDGYFQAKGLLGHTGDFDLYTATRIAPSWPFDGIAPIEGAGINTSDDENDPSVSGDGLTLVFARTAPGQRAQVHLATRPSLSVPFTYVGPIFATAYSSPFLREDGQALYVGSNPDGGSIGAIYRALRRGSTFDQPAAIAEINSGFGDQNPIVTPDDLTIYFNSRRPRGSEQGPGQIWVAIRTSTNAPFSAPTNVAELNSAQQELFPSFVTADGCVLYFVGALQVEPYGTTLYEAQKTSP